MNFSVVPTDFFNKELKKILKKHKSFKNDILELVESLEKQPNQGINLGNNCYKIRITITSKGKGKSGGARVITYVYLLQTTVYLLSIYDKSDKENITDKEIKELLKHLDS